VSKDQLETNSKNSDGIARGLIIGVSGYHHINPLPSIVLDDAKDIARVLTSPQHCGYSSSNVITLLDDEANLAAIRAALQ
jgi:hypothetical protein